MGGGAGKPAIDFDEDDCGITPTHTKPFYIELEISCEDFPKAPLWFRAETNEQKLRARKKLQKKYGQTTGQAPSPRAPQFTG